MSRSSYASRRHSASCAFSQECEEPGTVLTRVRGQVEWICAVHFRDIQREIKG